MVSQVNLPHLPPDLAVYVALYKDAENAAFLKEQLLAGNAEFEYAFIDAAMVLTTTHVLAATFRALNDYLNDRLKSRNVHSEIVFSLSPNNNIGEAFRRFGVQEATKSLLVLKVATRPDLSLESVRRHLSDSIRGTECAFDDTALGAMADVERIRKVYKISAPTNRSQQGPPAPSATSGIDEGKDAGTRSETRALERQILGIMALRGAT